jgi:N-acetyltransferase
MVSLDVPVLSGSLVRLEPLSMSHVPGLAQAAEEDRGSYGFTWVPRAAEVAEYVRAQQERPGLTPFAQVRVADGRAVGCTAYFDLRTRPARGSLYAVQIGFTWLAGSAQGTGINAEAKLLLFTYAFETLRVARVDLSTDARNDRSRRAIAALGAHFEGVLRSWSASWAPGEEGRLLYSAIFAGLAGEWPGVKSSLATRVAGAASSRAGALRRYQRVGDGIDWCQLRLQLGAQAVTRGECLGRVIADLRLAAVRPDQQLQRQVEGRQWHGIHDGRPSGRVAEGHEHGLAQLQPGLARLLALVDHREHLDALGGQDLHQPRDGVSDRPRAYLGGHLSLGPRGH